MALRLSGPDSAHVKNGTKSVFLNKSHESVVLLRSNLTKRDIGSLLKMYRAALTEWLLGEMMSVREDLSPAAVGGRAPCMLAGLAGRMVENADCTDGSIRSYRLADLAPSQDAWSAALTFAAAFPPLPGGSNRTAVLNMPIQAQRSYLEVLVGKDGRNLLTSLSSDRKHQVAGEKLEIWLHEAADAESFIDHLVAFVSPKVSQNGAQIATTSLGELMFLVFLRAAGLLLLPTNRIGDRLGSLRTEPEFCRPKWLDALINDAHELSAGTSRSNFRLQDLVRVVRTLYLASSIDNLDDISHSVCQHLRTTLPRRPDVVWATNLLLRTRRSQERSAADTADHGSTVNAEPVPQTGNRLRYPRRKAGFRKNLFLGDLELTNFPRGERSTSPLHVNLSRSVPAVLKNMPKQDVRALVDEFRNLQSSWLFEQLTTARRDVAYGKKAGINPKLMYGLSGCFADQPSRKGERRWRFRVVDLDSARESAALDYARTFERDANVSPLAAVMRMNDLEQRHFLELIVGPMGSHVLTNVKGDFAETFTFPDLEALACESADLCNLVEKTLVRAISSFTDARGFCRHRNRLGEAMFLTFLRSRDLLLLPTCCHSFSFQRIPGTLEPFFPDFVNRVSRPQAAPNTGASTIDTAVAKTLRTMWLTSSIGELTDITDPALDAFRAALSEDASSGGAITRIQDAISQIAPCRNEDTRPASGPTSSAIIGMASEHVVRCGRAQDGREIVLNTSTDDLLVLRHITKKDLAEQIAGFRTGQNDFLFKILATPRRDMSFKNISSLYPEVLYGLSGCLGDVPRVAGHLKTWHLTYLRTRGASHDEANEFLSRFAPIENGTARTALLGMNEQDQLRYLRIVLGPRNEHMRNCISSTFRDRYLAPELEASLDRASSVAAFLQSLMESLDRRDAAGQDVCRNHGAAMFLAHLRQAGVVLLPLSAIHYRWSVLKIGSHPFLPSWYNDHLSAVAAATRLGELRKYKPEDLFRSARGLYFSASIEEPSDITVELAQVFKSMFRTRTDVGWAINLLFDVTGGMLGPGVVRGKLKRVGDIRKSASDPFSWVRTGIIKQSRNSM